jgi:hypothetical protein
MFNMAVCGDPQDRPHEFVIGSSSARRRLFPLTKDTAIGFSGDVATAALLLGVLRRQLPKREHKDIASLLQWLPRLFQSGVATVQAKKKRVWSSVPHLPTPSASSSRKTTFRTSAACTRA